MNLKQLYNSKRKYYEAERVYGKTIYEFIRNQYKSMYGKELKKSIGARIEFEEIGKYSKPELVISSSAEVLTDEMIGALIHEYNLKVNYKCVSTGLNTNTGEIIQKARVYFGHDWGDEKPYTEVEEDVVNGIIISYNNLRSDMIE